jgi:putative membrane protein
MTSTVITTATAAVDRWTGHWAGGPGGWWFIVPILWFGFMFAVLATFAFFGRRRWRFAHGYAGQRAGEARLAERYAAGEIDESEYERRLSTLRRMGGTASRGGPTDWPVT